MRAQEARAGGWGELDAWNSLDLISQWSEVTASL